MAKRWYEVNLDVYDYAGNYPAEYILDIEAENPGEATYQAIGDAMRRAHVQRHLISVQRVKYNDLRPMEQRSADDGE